MNEFKEYIISEYKPKLSSFAAVDFKFIHSSNTRLDKKSGKPLVNNIIKVSIKFKDNHCNTLSTDTLTFENNFFFQNRIQTSFIIYLQRN